MTIDETIQHEREVAQERRNIAKRFECVDNINIFIKCAEEHEQLAEWLEELKEYRDLEEQGLLLKLPSLKNNSETPNIVGNVKNYEFWDIQRFLKVIGNIFDNPELLENKECD